jgi:DNA-binding transcriptional ArsR family regulator
MHKQPSANIFQIKDRETLKVITDPLRAQIMEALTAEPLTVKQVADRLGLAPSKLYYHFNMLEKFGFIRVAETRQVSNMIEKRFQAIASCFDVAPALLTATTDEGKDSMYAMIVSTLDTTREDMLRSIQARLHQLDQGAEANPRHVVINRDIRYIPDENAREFSDRVRALLEEFASLEVPKGTPGAMNYGLAVTFYPSFHYEEEK